MLVITRNAPPPKATVAVDSNVAMIIDGKQLKLKYPTTWKETKTFWGLGEDDQLHIHYRPVEAEIFNPTLFEEG